MKRVKITGRRFSAPAVLGLSYALGSIPFSNVAARALRGIDLRDVGTGTVSGTGLHEVAGFGPLAVVGCAELAKGAVGPLLAQVAVRRPTPALTAAAAGAAVAGHNWSPFLGFEGGRGVSVALGASLVTSPEAAMVLGLGLGGGRLARQSGAGCALAIAVLPPLLWMRRGPAGLWLGVSLAVPLVAKRLAGNHPPAKRDLRHYANRLLFDRDPSDRPSGVLIDCGARSPSADGTVSGDRAESSGEQSAAMAAAEQH